MRRAKTVVVVSCLVAGLGSVPLPTSAQTAQTADEEDREEEKMDESLRKMGFISGQAFQCHTEPAAQTKMERQALDMANGILRLFGSDRAFSFAAAYGAGAASDLDKAKCPDAIKEYDAMLAKLKVLAAR